MRALLLTLVTLTLGSAAEASAVSRGGGLDSVIGVLQSMLQKFTAQFAGDRHTWDEHLALSQEQERDKTAFIAEQKSAQSQATSLLNAKRAESASLAKALAALQQEQAETETSLKELTEMRQSEHQQHEAELGDLIKTIAAVNKALEVLAGHYAATPELVQEIRHTIQMGLTALQVRTPEAKVVLPDGAAAFLQGTGTQPEWLGTDGSKYEKYSSQGGGSNVMKMLSDMRGQLEDSKTASISRENEARRQYEETRAAKEEDLARTKAEIGAKTTQAANCEATIESAQANIDQATADIADAEAFLKQLLADRATFQAEFDQRSRTRQDERAATQAALDALQSVSAGNAAFVQAPPSPYAQMMVPQAPSPFSFIQLRSRANALQGLQATGLDLQTGPLSLVATALGQRATGFMAKPSDAMEPVKNLLHELIRRLEAELSEETSQHDWCDSEKTTAATSQAEREKQIHTLQQKVDQTTTSVSTLKAEILFLQEELARVAQETTEAIAVRKAEAEQFATAKADHDEVISALERAITALNGQYSFMQAGDRTNSPFGQYEGGGSDGSSVIAMLQDLLNRYGEARTELVANEEEASTAHEKLLQENENFRVDTTALKNSKTALRRETLGIMGTSKTDLKVNMIELQQVNKYLQDLRPSCDDIRSTFEERKKRRDAEIAALKEALEVISDPTSI